MITKSKFKKCYVGQRNIPGGLICPWCCDLKTKLSGCALPRSVVCLVYISSFLLLFHHSFLSISFLLSLFSYFSSVFLFSKHLLKTIKCKLWWWVLRIKRWISPILKIWVAEWEDRYKHQCDICCAISVNKVLQEPRQSYYI